MHHTKDTKYYGLVKQLRSSHISCAEECQLGWKWCQPASLGPNIDVQVGSCSYEGWGLFLGCVKRPVIT